MSPAFPRRVLANVSQLSLRSGRELKMVVRMKPPNGLQ
jgi:hypothetical protein